MQMRQLYDDSRAWIAVTALAMAAISTGGFWLMRLEAASSPTCIVSQCDGAHVPGPFFLAWMFATVGGHYIALAAAGVACYEGWRWATERTSPGLDRALLVAGGPVALAAMWISSLGLGTDSTGFLEWLATVPLGLLLVPMVVLGTSYMWVGGVAAGGVMIVRREGSPWVALAIVLFSVAAGAYGVWVLHFNDGRFN
jgi:hypothetical protein